MLLNDVLGVCAYSGNREMKIVQPREESIPQSRSC